MLHGSPARSPSLWRWASLALIIALGCRGEAGSDVQIASTSASSFLDELRTGRLEPAWEGTSAEFKSLMGLESLRDFVKRHPGLKGQAELKEARLLETDGDRQVECLFQVSTPAKGRAKAATSKIKVLTASDGLRWKVEGLSTD